MRFRELIVQLAGDQGPAALARVLAMAREDRTDAAPDLPRDVKADAASGYAYNVATPAAVAT